MRQSRLDLPGLTTFCTRLRHRQWRHITRGCNSLAHVHACGGVGSNLARCELCEDESGLAAGRKSERRKHGQARATGCRRKRRA